MANQPRVAKVLVSLVASMTIGAVVLMALGNNPPAAGPFCLSAYYNLDPIQKTITTQAPQTPERWNRIDVFYSGTKSGNITQLASLFGLKTSENLNYHFIICNGQGGEDGKIMSTEKWVKQWSCIPDTTWYGSPRTIRICIIADPQNATPTDCQLKRLDKLIESLYRKFSVTPEKIFYPEGWK